MNIEKELEFLKKVSNQYAEALGNKEYLTQFRKSKKAMLINKAEEEGVRTGQARESYAYSHPDYLELLKGLREAIVEAEKMKHLVKVCLLQIESKKMEEMRLMSEMKLR